MSKRLKDRVKTSEEKAVCGFHLKLLGRCWGDMRGRWRLEVGLKLGVEGAGGSLYPDYHASSLA